MISRQALARRRRLGERQLSRWDYGREWRTGRAVGKAGTTRKPCSCFMCGNPRRLYGNALQAKTVQERRLPPVEQECLWAA